ncbi:MAG TPA: cytochrome P450 [Solirubrobacteraceae bacterium]|jgi:cytochrome P450|nr:cytochrome P450 [Solirubrobacteraceae bacterium]
MPRVQELQLPTLDYTDPTLRGARFHERMRELRAAGWLAAGPYGYAVLDREGVEFFLRTRSAVFPGMTIAEIFDVREGPLYEEMRRNILHINGADHTRLRRLVNPSLSPRAVERYRPVMRELLAGIWKGIEGVGDVPPRGSAPGGPATPGGEASAPANPATQPPAATAAALAEAPAAGMGTVTCEFVGALAKPYPSQAIAHVMGVPLEDAAKLHHWSNWIQRQFDAISMTEQKPAIEQAVAEFYEYAWELVRARREQPGDDLISLLIAATGADEDGREVQRLSDVECVNLILNLLIGGVDTTQSQLAHAVRLLAEHPDQWELLAQRPELAPQAVEEALRYEPITPFTARIVTEELTFRDVVFPAGTIVMVCAFTGNRDLPGTGAGAGSDADTGSADGERAAAAGEAIASERPDATAGAGGDLDRFDIAVERDRARVLTFGAGVHFCVGANLARVELQEALAFLAPRMRGLELAGEPVFDGITGIYGLSELPLRFAAA